MNGEGLGCQTRTRPSQIAYEYAKQHDWYANSTQKPLILWSLRFMYTENHSNSAKLMNMQINSIPFQLFCEYANNTPKTSQLCKLAQWQLIPDHSWICKPHKSIMWGKPRFQEAHEYVNESRAYTNPTRSCYTHFLSCDLRMEGNLPPSSWWRTHVYIHVYIRKSLLVSQTRS